MNQSLPTRQVVYNLVEEFIEAVEGLTNSTRRRIEQLQRPHQSNQPAE